MRDQQLGVSAGEWGSGLRRPDVRSFIVAGALLLIAIGWWSGLLGPNDAPVIGGFGTLFTIVAVVSFAHGIHAHRLIADSPRRSGATTPRPNEGRGAPEAEGERD